MQKFLAALNGALYVRTTDDDDPVIGEYVYVWYGGYKVHVYDAYHASINETKTLTVFTVYADDLEKIKEAIEEHVASWRGY